MSACSALPARAGSSAGGRKRHRRKHKLLLRPAQRCTQQRNVSAAGDGAAVRSASHEHTGASPSGGGSPQDTGTQLLPPRDSGGSLRVSCGGSRLGPAVAAARSFASSCGTAEAPQSCSLSTPLGAGWAVLPRSRAAAASEGPSRCVPGGAGPFRPFSGRAARRQALLTAPAVSGVRPRPARFGARCGGGPFSFVSRVCLSVRSFI